MKRAIVILAALLLTGCIKDKTTVINDATEENKATMTKIGSTHFHNLYDVEWEGHSYLMLSTNSGVAITHAEHCH